MSDILCIYYSRTGNTKKAMEEIAAALTRSWRTCGTTRTGAAGGAGCAVGWTPCAKTPAPWSVGDSLSPGGLPLGDLGHTGVGRAIQRRRGRF
ncbi:MAG: hypothetical protein ACLTYN_08265 [Dysosmobacter welbionis]